MRLKPNAAHLEQNFHILLSLVLTSESQTLVATNVDGYGTVTTIKQKQYKRRMSYCNRTGLD